jgi:molybdate transport system substrate-binding protein
MLAATALACSAPDDASSPVVVSAASSLTDVVTQLARAYAAGQRGVTITTNFASSGTLVQQIRQGAGVDLFIAAAAREMDLLAAEGLIDGATRRVIASNELVLVASDETEAVTGLADLGGAAVERIALGAPASVPAGAYAREALQRAGLWAAVEQKAVFTTNVRQALAYVERGDVDAALVYRTDALTSAGIRVVAVAPLPPGAIQYPAAVVAGSSKREGALRFLEFASGPQGVAIFQEHGFGPPAHVGRR